MSSRSLVEGMMLLVLLKLHVRARSGSALGSRDVVKLTDSPFTPRTSSTVIIAAARQKPAEMCTICPDFMTRLEGKCTNVKCST